MGVGNNVKHEEQNFFLVGNNSKHEETQKNKVNFFQKNGRSPKKYLYTFFFWLEITQNMKKRRKKSRILF